MVLDDSKYKNNKTNKVVIVAAVSKDAWVSRRCQPGVAEQHVYFKGTRNGQGFGATHIASLSKFEQSYTCLGA